MNDDEQKELVDKISYKIQDDVKKGLLEVSMNLSASNLANGTTEANGFRFGEDEMSDFISDLMVGVASNLIEKIVVNLRSGRNCGK